MVQKMVTEDDEGKRVVDSHGETVGMVSEVKNGTAYVDPDPGITGLRADGTVVAAEQSLSKTADDGLVCTVRDITEQKRQRELADYYRSVVEDVFGESDVGVLIVDSSNRVALTNQTTERYFGLEDTSVEGRAMDELVEESLKQQVADPAAFVEGVTQTNEDSASTDEFEVHVLPGNGRDERYLEHRSQPIRSGEYTGGRLELYYDVSERKHQEQELRKSKERLERSNERLRTLNDLNALVQDITQTLIAQSDREGIERAVCEALGESGLYSAASIGEVAPEGEAGTLRTSVVRDGEFVDPHTATALESDAAMRAARTGDVQVVRELDHTDTESTAWITQARDHGDRSAVMVPIGYEETSYVVLTLYTTRTNPCHSQERTVVRRLSEVIGHAINGVETKQRLFADTVVELEFSSADPTFFFNTVSAELDCTVRLNDTVRNRDGDFVYYVTVRTDAVDDARAVFDRMDAVNGARLVSEDSDDECVFEISVTGKSIGRMLAEQDAKITTAVSEEGTTRLTATIGPQSDVRTVVDAINARYANAEFTARREATRSDTEVRNVFDENLTDKQRSAVQAAYHSGFYSWPRESTGEDVAESLGISASTYHQHLRAAHRAILLELVEGDDEERPDDETE
ncbi:bacterio-opsin activator domain-containing protein [Halogranum rubrum]|uniref:PAS domain-containing protein n=1 Tax=Halogranum salarium B-1 TaxID=1210908 RepID=J3A642_9EURY|nr:bacterio-opsin activator domain-containing protein [Halogranum salarium]EJN60953.1 hypothetical protein HSB1_15560 [Halogranum salarium B-1]